MSDVNGVYRAESPEDVMARLTPEQREAVLSYRRAIARRAGRGGTGKSKARTPAQCRKAQRAAMAARLARKRSRMPQDASKPAKGS